MIQRLRSRYFFYVLSFKLLVHTDHKTLCKTCLNFNIYSLIDDLLYPSSSKSTFEANTVTCKVRFT